MGGLDDGDLMVTLVVALMEDLMMALMVAMMMELIVALILDLIWNSNGGLDGEL